jgi:pre-rRNA-processing protein IPI3
MDQVIVSASAPISGSQTTSVLIHDLSTGTSLASFKQSSTPKHCTALINTTAAQGGLILAVQPDKALLNVYSFQKVLLHIL